MIGNGYTAIVLLDIIVNYCVVAGVSKIDSPIVVDDSVVVDLVGGGIAEYECPAPHISEMILGDFVGVRVFKPDTVMMARDSVVVYGIVMRLIQPYCFLSMMGYA